MKDIKLEKIEDYYYIFKSIYKKKIEKEFHFSHDRINYNSIRIYDEDYKRFIKKLIYLYNDNSSFTQREINDIVKHLESKNLMDRLKGLKMSRGFIKIEVMEC